MSTRPAMSGDDVLLRLPPNNITAERSVLGCCLLDRAALLTIFSQFHLQPEDFFHPAHRHIFEAIRSLFNKNITPDFVSLTNALESMGRLADVGGPEYVAGLTNVVPSVKNAEHYARIVREKAQMRRIARLGTEINEMAVEGRTELRHLLDWSTREFLDLLQSREEKSYATIETVAGEFVQRFTDTYDEGETQGVASGIADLDRKILGFQPGNLVILAARPSQGKTALALDFARNMAEAGKSVAFLSLEMSKEELVVRLLCAAGLLDSYKLRKKQLTKKKDEYGLNDWDRLNTAMTKLSKMKIFIDDTSSLAITELRAKVKTIALENHLDCVIVDYLQLIDGELGSGDMRVQEVSKISRHLKGLARELKVPVIALSQLSRHIERREGFKKVPQLSDLRESGAIEQDADVVLFIHREISEEEEREGRQYDPDEVQDTQLIVAKNRNGEIGKVYLEFFRRYATFKASTQPPVTYKNT